ncbi:Protein kinase-like domain [Pseudocohnilembus persalinus]|uniref:Protein kinase-like domain n=1 Tax=Pseudocohnilembus persalinus TaxID=266149 RepID=A0A0V0QLP5_PSEPJ|nr:Protein kinase-like domain [Pseudocohnilembus persalinus]|eukprot:KRX03079.1 Protein kinase-like domain [Pseudocohnilembus persalinus]
MKIFNIEMLKMQGLYEYAIKEVKNQSLLNHKNIVKLIECMRDDQNIYLIMEFCEQGNLINYIDQFQPNYEQCIKIAVDILNGLIELHRNNILHRDLKPNNILVKNGVFKISDFGVSTISKMAQTKCGTQKYMAPEVLKGKTYGFKSDLWSFGVIFYYLLFQEYPFGKEAVQTMSNVHLSNIYLNLENSLKIQPVSQINNDNETVNYNYNNSNYVITSRSNNYFDDVQYGNTLLSPNKNNKKQQKQQNFPGSVLSINCVRKKSLADDNSYMSDVPFEFEQSFTNLDSFEKTPQLLFKKPSHQFIDQSKNKNEDIQKLQLFTDEQNGQEKDFLHKQKQQEEQFVGPQMIYNQQQIQQSKQLQLNGKNTQCQIQYDSQNQEKIHKKKKQFGVPILPPCKGKNNQIPEDIY